MMRLRFVTVLIVFGMAVVAGAGELDRLPLGASPLAWQIGSAGPGDLYDCKAGEVLSFDDMVAAMAGSQIVLLGEEHTHMPQKLLQAKLLEALTATGRPLVLGMEFFQRSDDGVLGQWVSGSLDGDDFLLASHWYDRGGYNWEYYRPVMEVARKNGIRVVGLNVPRSIPRAVSHGGLESLDEEQRTLVGPVITAGSPQHRYLIARYFGDTVALLPPGWFQRMYAAQCLWDTVMARSIMDALPSGGTLVAIAGSGHVAYRLGIARRIVEEARRRGLPEPSILTLCTAKAPAMEEGDNPHGHPMGGGMGSHQGRSFSPAVFARSLADVVAVFEDDGGVEAFPAFGVKLTEEDGRITVARVWPGSVAEDAGLKKGDQIKDLGGWTPPDLPHLRLKLATLRWGDRLDLAVVREGQDAWARAILEPSLLEEERTVAPGWGVRQLPTFAPDSRVPEPVPPGSREAAVPRFELVTRAGENVRVEAWAGETLVAVHELDSQGFTTRSLYREPLSDGAVQVFFERDADGGVVRQERRDRSGATIGSSGEEGATR